jgi:hypothetical protein
MAFSIQSRLDTYRSLNLGLRQVVAFQIEQVPFEIDDPSQTIRLELLGEDRSGKIELKFTGVQDLKLEGIRPGTTCLLEIVPIMDDQLEGLRFRVFNVEQDFRLSFYCLDFEFNELSSSD